MRVDPNSMISKTKFKMTWQKCVVDNALDYQSKHRRFDPTPPPPLLRSFQCSETLNRGPSLYDLCIGRTLHLSSLTWQESIAENAYQVVTAFLQSSDVNTLLYMLHYRKAEIFSRRTYNCSELYNNHIIPSPQITTPSGHMTSK